MKRTNKKISPQNALKQKYEEKETKNPDEIEAMRDFWEKALKVDLSSQFSVNTPSSFRKEIRQKLSDFLN